jgi:hypothetical protein
VPCETVAFVLGAFDGVNGQIAPRNPHARWRMLSG